MEGVGGLARDRYYSRHWSQVRRLLCGEGVCPCPRAKIREGVASSCEGGPATSHSDQPERRLSRKRLGKLGRLVGHRCCVHAFARIPQLPTCEGVCPQPWAFGSIIVASVDHRSSPALGHSGKPRCCLPGPRLGELG